MFLFFDDPLWQSYKEELGIIGAALGLKEKGYLNLWVDKTVDPESPTAVRLEGGGVWYRASCPHYAGYWLAGHIGSVECKLHDGLIPGIVWYTCCREQHENCPFAKRAAQEMEES